MNEVQLAKEIVNQIMVTDKWALGAYAAQNLKVLGTDENYPSDIYECGITGTEQCLASNYDSEATYTSGCEYPVQGCTDELASNYNVMVVSDNGTCEYLNDSWIGVNTYGNSYYYPVIPRFNLKGKFNEKIYGLQTNIDGTEKIPFGNIVWDSENWTAEDLTSEVTIENSNDESLKINLNYSIDNSNILKDNSGNKNLGFVISDKKTIFDERTSTVKKSKSFNTVKRSKNNGAF